MPPGANRAASKPRARHCSGRSKLEGRASCCAPGERWAFLTVIGWSSHTKPSHERNTHERTEIQSRCQHNERPGHRNGRANFRANEAAFASATESLSERPDGFIECTEQDRRHHCWYADIRSGGGGRGCCKPGLITNFLPSAQSLKNCSIDCSVLISSGLLHGLGLGAIAGRRGAEQLKVLKANCSRDSANLPVMDTLRTNISIEPEQFSNLRRATKLFDNLRICFHSAPILNAMFIESQTLCLAQRQ